MKLICKPNIQFDDDPERKLNLLLEKITSTYLFFPVFYNKCSGNTGKYNALKEWAYLSPRYFNPDPFVLEKFGLISKEYIFVREVSSGTLNYSAQPENLIGEIAHLLPPNIKVVLSLENKKKSSQYPQEWIILQEPVENIHSLIYYSKIVISSGDSMAREGALLGVPSIYCGMRDMAANRVMIERNMLLHINIHDVPTIVNGILEGNMHFEEQVFFRSKIESEWDDVPGFIYNQIKFLK
jgi:predicted glycosyltransferase